MRDGEQPRDERPQQRRDAYDWFVLAIAFSALGATAMAAWFTYQQASVAQDQEIRSLRAYVSIELSTDPGLDDDGLPGVLITTENVGQTPAYRLHVLPTVTITGRDDPRAQSGGGGNCGDLTETATGGLSLARAPIKTRSGVSPSHADRARAAVASGVYEVRADILACYRDVFGAVRHVHMCRRWFSSLNRIIACDGEQDEHS